MILAESLLLLAAGLTAGAGVLIDRMDRKQVMVVTMVVRALVVASLPFVNSVLGLVFAFAAFWKLYSSEFVRG